MASLGAAISCAWTAARGATAQEATPASAGYAPVINPADFTTIIDNPYMPLTPGRIFVYEGKSGGAEQSNVVSVTPETRRVMGVTCVVVNDRVFEGDTLLEDTNDWYAQDADGNVWYFGEDSKSFEDGKVSTEGSWEAGVDGAQPGIVMEADPHIGDTYRQEYDAGEAEDMAEVLDMGQSITVPYGAFEDVLVTKEWTPLDPGVVEHKSYAPGLGMVLSESVQGEEERFELVDVQSAGGTPQPSQSPVG